MTTEAKIAKVLATLKSVEAGLTSLSQQHPDLEARQVYTRHVPTIRRIVKRLSERYQQVLEEEPQYAGIGGKSGGNGRGGHR